MQKWSEEDNKFVEIGGHETNVAVGPGGRPYMTNSIRDIYWPVDACSSATHVTQAHPEDSKAASQTCTVKYGLSNGSNQWRDAKRACEKLKLNGFYLKFAQVNNKSE